MKNHNSLKRILSLMFAVCFLWQCMVSLSSCDMFGSSSTSYIYSSVEEGFYKVHFEEDALKSVSVGIGNTLIFPESYGLRTMEEEVRYFYLNKDSSYPRIQRGDGEGDGRYWEQVREKGQNEIPAGATLYVKWQNRIYNLRFCKDEVHGTTVQTGTCSYGSPVEYPEPPVPEGMRFVGWFNENYTVQYTNGTEPFESYVFLNIAFFPNGAVETLRFRPRFEPIQ